ncbi:hypothetical protein [Amycolatopsis silviterrae]|uniref:Uncharacterized protein n=1 Tax=Amycolatopsis silviterrae TaxID=1656914 RepID=A0ABW5HL65_9PSEU
MWPELEPLDGLPLRERFEWWIGGGRLPAGSGPGLWNALVQLLVPGLIAALESPEQGEPALTETEKKRYLGAVGDLYSYLEDHALIAEDDVLNRRLLLSLAMGEHAVSLPGSGYSPDEAVQRIVAVLTPERVAECERLAPVWTTLPKPEIARLHRAKQLVRIAVDLRDYVTDPEAVAAVSRWEPLYSVLP